MTKIKITREEWMVNAIAALRPVFKEANWNTPAKLQALPKNIKVSCSWPGGRSSSLKTIGQCWYPQGEKGVTELFISPMIDNPIQVLEIIVHELVHAAEGAEAGHGVKFKYHAHAVGLEGKMTATNAGPELTVVLKQIAKALGKYPHRSITASTGKKKQTTRMVKAECAECGYTVRTSRKWIEVAVPECPNADCGSHGFPMVPSC